MIKKNKEINIISLVYIVIYIIRYRDNLTEKLIYLGVGSLVIYFIWSMIINKKFDYMYILPSMMIYVVIDQIIHLI